MKTSRDFWAQLFIRKVPTLAKDLRKACELFGLRFELKIWNPNTNDVWTADMAGASLKRAPVRAKLVRNEPCAD